MISSRKALGFSFVAAMAALMALQVVPGRADHEDDVIVLGWQRMVGVPAAGAGAGGEIRGIPGGGKPWVIGNSPGQVTTDGDVNIHVRGLVFDPKLGPPLGGTTFSSFGVIVSCLVPSEDNLSLVPFNIHVPGPNPDGTFPVDMHGNSNIHGKIMLPNEFIAPIVLVTGSFKGNTVWLASTGF